MSKMLDRIGEYKVNTQGIGMTIIGYKSCDDIIVQFDNGEIAHTRMYRFNSGHVRCKNTKSRVGEISQTKNGMKMEIIAYRSSLDIDIRFEDGTLRRGVQYNAFKNGNIAYPKNRLGEQSISNNGMKMTIIRYKGSKDLDVQFEDGTIVKNKTYQEFKVGSIKNPNVVIRIGKIGVNNQGYKMKIIEYRGCYDIDVQFEDGRIAKHKRYSAFVRHKIAHPDYTDNKNKYSRIGETNIMSCGMFATIIGYRHYRDIDIQFENGFIVNNVAYNNFISGKIRHKCKKDRIGERKVTNQGLDCKIIDYDTYNNITIQLEDGSIITNIKYGSFLKGTIGHPKYSKCKHVATFNNKKYFLCICKKCKSKHMLCIDEMKDFECESQTCNNDTLVSI